MEQIKELTYKERNTEEYKAYIKGLCLLASEYVSRIRLQFARKADAMYLDPTVRRLVIAYGEEIEKLNDSRLRDFRFHAEHPDLDTDLDDNCLNNAYHYGQAIKLLFDIQ